MSTKRQSLDLTVTKIPDMHRMIMKTIEESVVVSLSRYEIHRLTGLRLSSVCGRVNELLASGQVRVNGTKRDLLTNRNVETLELTGV